MKLCSACDQFTLHDFSRLPDNTYSLKLTVLEAGARESCSFCSFLDTQLQQSRLGFHTHPDKTWVRLRNHPQVTRDRKNDVGYKEFGLQLHELELYLANTQLETKTERRTEGCFLGLAANTGEHI